MQQTVRGLYATLLAGKADDEFLNNCAFTKSIEMQRKLLFLVFVFSVTCALRDVNGTLEVKLPNGTLFNLVGKLTSTTFGIVRGGFGIFNRTLDRVINTFNRVEDRLSELLEEFRTFLVKGIPEFNIPILDPLHIDNIQFNIQQESGDFNGSASDVTIRHISKFVLDGVRFSDIGAWKFRLDLNVTLPFIRADGLYDVNALIGDTIHVFGDGKFWLNIYDIKLRISAIIKLEYTTLRLSDLGLNIKIAKLENYFANLMHDEKTGELYNRVISKMAPEALNILWPELKKPVEKQILTFINSALENASVANVVRRILNIG